ncbi:MAG TPA: DUF938 domain-containing protein [Geopsychrobacteraceae bacterium]|nr:DUF938 domain-containing protein [Geopsychrobacteraceae bacterium]
MISLKNFNISCEKNKDPILDILIVELAHSTTVLEVGSGSGQHALYFAEGLPHLRWQSTELPAMLADLYDNLQTSSLTNISPPMSLDVRRRPWLAEPVSAIFSANTLHIMSWDHVEHFFAGAGETLRPGGRLVVYGPFRYDNDFTSQSNAKFDCWLKERDSQSGIRDFEAVDRLARNQGMKVLVDHKMPSNNQLIVWERRNDQRPLLN